LIDISANIGLYSWILGRAAVVPRMVASSLLVKVSSGLWRRKRNNVAAMVQVHPCAVGTTDGSAYLTPGPPENIGQSGMDRVATGKYSVAVAALDNEIDVRNSVIAIKIEGFEMEVLEGR
jgi:FkbM family methyltransferase